MRAHLDRPRFSLTDRLITQFDWTLKTLLPGGASARRENPAQEQREAELSARERRHSAGLMRINHTGEVCAQALYQGQALTAQLPQVRANMDQAAREEIDHLDWCEQRLQELNSRPSLLNPLWYSMSYGLGAAAGLAGDQWSLGFVAETEDQVCDHLREHLGQLPSADHKSRAILEQMLVDERQHAQQAMASGGSVLPFPVKKTMRAMSQVMKMTAYRI